MLRKIPLFRRTLVHVRPKKKSKPFHRMSCGTKQQERFPAYLACHRAFEIGRSRNHFCKTKKERRQSGGQHSPFVILTFSPCYRYKASHRHWLRKGRRPADVESEMVTTLATSERTQHKPLQLDTNEEAFC